MKLWEQDCREAVLQVLNSHLLPLEGVQVCLDELMDSHDNLYLISPKSLCVAFQAICPIRKYDLGYSYLKFSTVYEYSGGGKYWIKCMNYIVITSLGEWILGKFEAIFLWAIWYL